MIVMMKVATIVSLLIGLVHGASLTDVASGTGKLGTFIAKLKSAGVLPTISNGTFTIFAPQDSAFQNATMPSNKTMLARQLRYHVAPGNLSVSQLNGTLTTLQGDSVAVEPITIDGETMVAVNDAYITEGDQYYDNGVIHI